ncbi:hypothetical protein [Dactylosporangium cerinum]
MRAVEQAVLVQGGAPSFGAPVADRRALRIADERDAPVAAGDEVLDRGDVPAALSMSTHGCSVSAPVRPNAANGMRSWRSPGGRGSPDWMP